MAVPAPYGHETEKKSGDLAVQPDLTAIKKAAARMYAKGFKRAEIARAMVDYLSPDTTRMMDQRVSNARRKLMYWERNGQFLDYIWELGLSKAHLEMPLVIDGVLGKAKRGRVDAARLLMEVTGRHNPKGEIQSPSVVIQFGDNIPRPKRRADIDLEVVDEEDVV